MKEKISILITNDDSINAKGIRFLAGMMKRYGDVTVVAPAEPQSGKSAALSLATPQYLIKVHEEEGLRMYSFEGTPVDCVKLAMNVFFRHKRPDLLMSGINHGPNFSVASLYSGTLGACIEGTLYEIPSIGFSINTHDSDPDFSCVEHFGHIVLEKYLKEPHAKDVYLNINFPNLPTDEVKGIRMARRGLGRWVKEYEIRQNEEGGEYYFMKGEFENLETEPEFGDHTLNVMGNYVTVVPHKIDTTDYNEVERLRKIWNID
jgi:5'-nucleotidase